jgi:toxoflavin biosynthesis protein ToxD
MNLSLKKKQNLAIFLFCISLTFLFPNPVLSDNKNLRTYQKLLESSNLLHREALINYNNLHAKYLVLEKDNKELKKKIERLNKQIEKQIEIKKRAQKEHDNQLVGQHNTNEKSDSLFRYVFDMVYRKPIISLPLGEDVTLEIVYVKEGTFKMGTEASEKDGLFYESENEEVERELPSHEVTCQEFYIGQCEVTNKQYELFLKETGLEEHNEQSVGIDWGTLPVSNVSLNDAIKFIKWLKGKLHLEVKLPTEEEWEWAARGDKNLKYPWGNYYPELKEEYGHWGDKHGGPVKVGSYEKGKSWCGSFDMSGNVSEWMGNRYYSYSDDSAARSTKKHVSRGGSYVSDIVDVRTSSRYIMNSDSGKPVVGFRIMVQL